MSAAILLTLAGPAQAAFPGANGRIAFSSNETGNWEIYSINSDGTGKTQLTNNPASDAGPSWSSDGQKIAFTSNRDGNDEIYAMNADGSGQARLTTNPAQDGLPSWSPDGGTLAFARDITGCPYSCVHLMDADGSDERFLVEGAQPEFSPDGQKIAFYRDWGVRTINLDGTGLVLAIPPYVDQCTFIEYDSPNWSPDGGYLLAGETIYTTGDPELCGDPADPFSGVVRVVPDGSYGAYQGFAEGSWPAWSPDGQKLVCACTFESVFGLVIIDSYGPYPQPRTFLVPGTQPDWQPLRPPGYARPKGASPINVRLVPAYEACTNSNAEHGAPFSVASCSPPVEESSYAATGHGDGHPVAAKMTGLVTFREVGESPIDPGNGDQADVQVTASITDVRNPDFSDYTGELRLAPFLRITDRESGGTYSPPIHPATAVDTPLGFTLTCQTTTDSTVGSSCSATTTADAVLPGVVREGRRAVWQLGQIQVYDGGADGDADTTGDNTLFAEQGLFAP